MKRTRVTKETMTKHPIITRVFLIAALPLVPLIVSIWIIAHEWRDIVDTTKEWVAAAFLPWDK